MTSSNPIPSEWAATLAEAVESANIPTLLMVLLHLTGDMRWIGDRYQCTRIKGLDDNDSGGLPPDVQAEVRESARKAIVGITLFGGFASTVSWPVTTWLLHEVGWRNACLFWAGVQVLLLLPLHASLPRLPGLPNSPATSASAAPAADGARAAQQPGQGAVRTRSP